MVWLLLLFCLLMLLQQHGVAQFNSNRELALRPELFMLNSQSLVMENDTRFGISAEFFLAFGDEDGLIVAGNPFGKKDDSEGPEVGVVQVFRFVRDTNVPLKLQKVFDLQGELYRDRFGKVAIDGTTLFVGDYGPRASVFIYEKQTGADVWSLNSTLTAANVTDSLSPEAIQVFGQEIDAANGVLMVKAYEGNSFRKYLFQRNGDGEWDFVRSVEELDEYEVGYFDGNMIIARPTSEANGEKRKIRVIYRGDDELWQIYEEILIENAGDEANGRLGGIDYSDGTILVGLPKSDQPPRINDSGGFVTLHRKPVPDQSSNWTQSQRFFLEDWNAEQNVGQFAVLLGGNALVGGTLCGYGFYAFSKNETAEDISWVQMPVEGYDYGACIIGTFQEKYLILGIDSFITVFGPGSETIAPTVSPTMGPSAAPIFFRGDDAQTPGNVFDERTKSIIAATAGSGFAFVFVIGALVFYKRRFGGKALDRGCHFHFFLSHRQQGGGEKASLLKEWLENSGYRVWFDQAQSDLTHDKMLKGIENSAMYMILLTPGVFESAAVKMELQHAIDLNKPFVMIHDPEFQFSIKDNPGCPVYMETLFKTHNSIEFTRREFGSKKLVIIDVMKRYANRFTYKPMIVDSDAELHTDFEKTIVPVALYA